MGNSRLAEAALAYAARGWAVFPLAPGGKLPAIPAAHPGDQSSACRGECGRFGHGVHDATTDVGVIARWWAHCPHANIGVSCGRASLVVLDLDVSKPGRETPPPEWHLPGVTCGADVLAVLAERAGARLPTETYTVRTGRGGLHLYFAAPPDAQFGNTAADQGNGIGWCVDTRAAGGYVVAAGSAVAGRRYTLVHDALPAPLPAWLAALLPNPSSARNDRHRRAQLSSKASRAGPTTPARRCEPRCNASSTLATAHATSPSTRPRSASANWSPPGCCPATLPSTPSRAPAWPWAFPSGNARPRSAPA
jgi:hypothetical protein